MIKHITPDHPEFEAIAATIKPIHLVHKEAFPINQFFAPCVTTKLYRRKEDVNKI